jgi:hypothetical protein
MHAPVAAALAVALASGCAVRDETLPAAQPEAAEPGPGAAPAARPDEPRDAKHARLLSIARQLRESDNMYFGTANLERLEDADTTKSTQEQMAQYEFTLAFELFKHGRAEEAEALFQSSFTRSPEVPLTCYLLAITQLRIGELQNCVHRHSTASCVFPLKGDGVHDLRGGTERALGTFLFLVERAPVQLRPQARWFANVSKMALGDYPGDMHPKVLLPPRTLESDYDIGKFNDLAMQLGVASFNLAGGVAIEDFDRDGFLDVFVSTADPEGQLRYWRGAGDGTFMERTEEAGIVGQLGGLNMVHADYDGDGWRDLLVLRGGWLGTYGRMPKSLLRNRGDGTFQDVTARAGLERVDYPVQNASFGDYDLDGDLDIFCGNETPPPSSGMRFPAELFRNEGDGTFTDVAAAAGVETFKLIKGSAWGDWNGDRYPDLYVSSQYDLNRLYRNNGDGTFTDVAPGLGVDQPVNSFSTWWWDYDNDGLLDLFVAGYGGDMNAFVKSWLRAEAATARNTLYRNEGGSFRDVTEEAGLTIHALTMGANYGDLDNDGWLDFYVGTGGPEFDVLMPNLMYRNDARGHFQNVTFSGGFGNLQKGHGIAFGDLDNDGDQDVFSQLGGMYPYDNYYNSLFENPGHGNHWLCVELVGVRSNRDALGCRVKVRFQENGALRDVYRWQWPRGSFGSGPMRQEIGLGRATRIESVEVWWPKTDVTQRFEDLALDSFYRVTEDAPAPEKLERRRVRLGGAGHS